MSYSIGHIARIIRADFAGEDESLVEHLVLDSRKAHTPQYSLFFALAGPRRDGHHFIEELYQKGQRNFVVSKHIERQQFPDANFLEVNDTLVALQELAAYHREQYNIPVIGITGSNGKTMVKEWLYQLLHHDHEIIRSPRSYNSQIGVPLSVWQIKRNHTLAIFEAGISLPGEMEKLEKIIRPTTGIFTNLGEAHSEGFNGRENIAKEKLKLFIQVKNLIHAPVEVPVDINPLSAVYNWGTESNAKLHLIKTEKLAQSTSLHAVYDNTPVSITIPFRDEASIANAMTCWLTMLTMGYSQDVITLRMLGLQPVNMRLELRKGINHCSIINDSYSVDMSSLEMALDFLDQQAGKGKKTLILSDLLQSAAGDEELYPAVMDKLRKHRVERLIGIGPRISEAFGQYNEKNIAIELYSGTDVYLQQFRSSQFRDEHILVKGARVFGFEHIVQFLEMKLHQTILEINLNAIAHNLKIYQQLLTPDTKVMAMVKAFAYGSGGAEIAGILQYHKVDYLGVAYADEGVELRRAGISLPVMVMNPEHAGFEAIIDNDLEPEIYSFEILEQFGRFLNDQGLKQYPVHIELETGMNRLGFNTADVQKLCDQLKESDVFLVRSVFSHLAGSEDPGLDDFTEKQFMIFNKAAGNIEQLLGYTFLKHISNSAATLRHPNMNMDMVRLGIGLYGVGGGPLDLQTVATLRSTVAQLKYLKKGESVSYNRKGIVTRDSIIATVRIGYADGYPRRLGNGVGGMFINGQLATVIGTVCMDMTMVDVTDIPGVKEGDDVIVFGKQLPVEQLSAWGKTIPYEIMTGISQRVKRVYYEE